MLILFSAMIFAFLFVACSGKRQVSDDTIKAYLMESYYGHRNLRLTEIRDITEEKGETKNKVIVTCTVSAENQYVDKTSNWTLQFEKMDGVWYGKNLKLGLDQKKLHELTESQFAEIAFDSYLNFIYFDINELKTDLDLGTAIALCTQYENSAAYYTQQEVEISLYWSDSDCSWRCDFDKTHFIGGKAGYLKADISCSYEEISDNYALIFDVEQDLNSYVLSNFVCRLRSGFLGIDEYTIKGDLPYLLDFELQNWSTGLADIRGTEMMCSSIPCAKSSYSSSNFLLFVYGDTLYCRGPGTTGFTEVVSGLHGNMPFVPLYHGHAEQ